MLTSPPLGVSQLPHLHRGHLCRADRLLADHLLKALITEKEKEKTLVIVILE